LTPEEIAILIRSRMIINAKGLPRDANRGTSYRIPRTNEEFTGRAQRSPV
jgi:hypothetical protein